MSAFIELTTGSREPPRLVYTTTSDIIFGLSMVAGAALGVLRLYSLYLDLDVKRLTVRKLRKELRELGASENESDGIGDFAESQKRLIEEAVRKAVAGVRTQMPPGRQLPPGRANEIHVELSFNALRVMSDLENGARMNITIESLSNFEEMAVKAGADIETLRNDLQEMKRLEQRVVEARAALNASPRISIQATVEATELGSASTQNDNK